jgi:HAE1 family hydrophobic/amphiphilic exporter-1
MKIARIAVDRPIFTIMVSLIVIILGAVALTRLPIDLMPDITSPTISISTSYAKASPLAMEELVTRPIEEAVSAVQGVDEITSQSSEGNSNVQVSFVWGTDLDAASNDIRDRLDRIISRLPDGANSLPCASLTWLQHCFDDGSYQQSGSFTLRRIKTSRSATASKEWRVWPV